MTCVSPHSSRKHPRYIILKNSQKKKLFWGREPACAPGRAMRFFFPPFLFFNWGGNLCWCFLPLVFVCFFESRSCKMTEREKKSLSRLLVAQLGRQILKVKSSLLPFPPFLLKDPIGRYCQRGNSDDDMFPVLPCQAVWSQSAEWANFEMCFSAHWELAALACGVCDI